MNMTHNIVPISPLSKEAQERMNIMKGYVQKIYSETIKTAINGYTNLLAKP